MIRKIIKIDEEKCNGCGACAAACHEGAIEMIDGKAKLTREDYCDGLGDCLPACPADAIGFEEREAPAYDEAAVLAAKKKTSFEPLPCGCPGMQSKSIQRERNACSEPVVSVHSQLSQWPVQIKLDAGDYSEKLTEILANNNIKSVTVVRMEVPCCGGIEQAVKKALQISGRFIPWRVVTKHKPYSPLPPEGGVLKEMEIA